MWFSALLQFFFVIPILFLFSTIFSWKMLKIQFATIHFAICFTFFWIYITIKKIKSRIKSDSMIPYVILLSDSNHVISVINCTSSLPLILVIGQLVRLTCIMFSISAYPKNWRGWDILFSKYYSHPNLPLIFKIHRKKIDDDKNLLFALKYSIHAWVWVV